MAKHTECAEFIASDSFKKQFDTILLHDREIFKEPEGWQNKSVSDSPLIVDFKAIWKQLKVKYQTELSALAYRAIPDQEPVAKVFIALTKRIQ